MKNWHDIMAEKNDREIHNILNNIMMDNKLSQKRKNKLLSKKQMVVAKKFNQHMINETFASSTRKFYLQTLRNFMVYVKKDNMKDVTKKDIEKYFESLKMVQNSKYSVQLFMRCFFKWFYKVEGDKLPKVISWIKPKKDRKGKKLPEEMLDKKEILKMSQVANNHRDTAIIRVLHESGTRASEFLGLSLKHVRLDSYGAVIMVNGKTGMRRIRLIESVPSLIQWMNKHPDNKNPNSPLWVNLKAWQSKPFGQSGLKLLLSVLSKRAKIKKKVHPHLLRHTRLTELSKDLTEPQLRIFAGWDKSSTMPSVYVHLSGKDVDNKLLQLAGKKNVIEQEREKKEREILKPKVCPRCEKVNSAESRFCDACSMALDIKTVLFLEDKREIADEKMVRTIKKVKKVHPDVYKTFLRVLSEEMYDKGILAK